MSNQLNFGTAGIRAIMGPNNNELNEHTVMNFAYNFGKFDDMNTIVIGYDTRHNSKHFAHIIMNILKNDPFNYNVIISHEPIPTPILSFATKYYNGNYGIMITASHNPKEFNGIKIYDNNGIQLLPNITKKLSDLQDKNNIYNENNNINYSKSDNINYISDDCYNEYILQVEKLIGSLNKSKESILLTSFHGTSEKLLTILLQYLGFNNQHWDELTSRQSGDFPNVITPNPEDKRAFDTLIKKAEKIDASLIIGTDPDADRIGFVECYNNGSHKYFTGNEIGLILLYLRYQELSSKDRVNRVVITSDVVSELISKLCINLNIQHIKTPVGFKFIANEIKQLSNQDLLLAFEESHGYLFDDIVGDKDALQTTAIIIKYKSQLTKNGLTFKDILDDLKSQIGEYKDKTLSIKQSQDEIKKFMDNCLSYTSQDICNQNILSINHNKDQNTIKFNLSDGFIIVRPSGTEPKIKIYFSLNINNIDEFINNFLNIMQLK